MRSGMLSKCLPMNATRSAFQQRRNFFASRYLFREDFGGRLCASLGLAEAFQAEKWLCAARVVLAIYCCAWVRLNAPEINIEQRRIHGLLDMYFAYSLIIFIALYLHAAADSTYRQTALAIDFFFAGTVTLFSGGPESPYVVLVVFVVLTSAYRSGLHGTNLTTVACALLLFVEVRIFERWPRYFDVPDTADFRTERLLLRGTFVIVISLLLAYTALRERRLRAESALFARVLSRAHVGGEIETAMEALFSEITPLYLPRKAVIALRKGNVEEVFFWENFRRPHNSQTGSVRTVLQFSNLEAAAFSFPAHTWYLNRSQRKLYRPAHLAFDPSGKRIRPLDSADWKAYLPTLRVPSIMVSSFSFDDALDGRLILIGPRIRQDNKEALRFLQNLLNSVSPFIRDIYVLRDVRVQAEDHVRSRLTRELHDGTLQFLLGMEMQIEVLRRQRTNRSAELETQLANVQNLVHQEVVNLRGLIENTKPLNFSPKELPDFLAELVARFRRDTGIAVRLETGEGQITLTPGVCHEIVRIVQEGLSNIRKHSRARNVVITLCEERAGQYKLSIGDDGEGFGFRGRVTHRQLDESHRGPGVIKERVRLIGGELTIDSNPGHGSRLEITIPEDPHG
jgi:signal transduction histidine kinase